MQDHTTPIHGTIGPSDDGLTSGFTESIDQERAVDSMPEEKGFGNIQEYYVSKSGPTRLFTATRYGKRYVLKCLKTDYLLTSSLRTPRNINLTIFLGKNAKNRAFLV